MFGFTGKQNAYEKSVVEAGLTYVPVTPAVVRSGLSDSVPVYRNVAYGRSDGQVRFSGDLQVAGMSWRESGVFLGRDVPNLSVGAYFSSVKSFDDGLAPVNVESNVFNDLYRVKCDDHRFATALLHQRFIDSLIEVGTGYFSITDGWLMVRRVNSECSFDVAQAQWSFLNAVILFFPPWMMADYGIDFAWSRPVSEPMAVMMPRLAD